MEKKKQIEVLKTKIRAVGRMARLWGIQRQNQQLILTLKAMCPDGKIPPGTLIQGKQGIQDKLKAFMFMKQADKENEKWRGPRRQTIDLMCQVKAGFARDYHHLLEQYARK